MGKTIKIRPRPGIILAGIAATGTDVEEGLGREWIRNGLALEVEKSKPAHPARKEK